MIKIDYEILNKALELWGAQSQMGMLQEECMELSVAIHKYQTREKSSSNMEKIYDEFADVLIMCEQAKKLLDMNEVQLKIDFKINRLNDRINNYINLKEIPQDD